MKRRAKHTLEFKMEAVRLVKGGQACSVTAKILGIPKAKGIPFFAFPPEVRRVIYTTNAIESVNASPSAVRKQLCY